MSPSPLRLAVVGAGWAGRRQCRAVQELARAGVDGLAVTAVVDPDPEAAAALAGELGVPAYRHLDPVLSGGRADAVSICSPHDSHPPLAIAAAAAGRHVLVEKPIAPTVTEATRMLAAAAAHRVVLYVAEQAAYDPLVDTLGELRAQGGLGPVVAAAVAWGFHAPGFRYPGRRAWLTRPELGGTGTWMLHGVHRVAQVRRVLGEIASVYAVASRTPQFGRDDLEGTMTALLTTTDGVPVTLVQSAECRIEAEHAGWTLFCEHGTVRAGEPGYAVAAGRASQPWRPYPPRELSSYALELAAFAATVRGGPAGPTTGASERRTLAVVEAGYESAATGQPVSLQERFGPL